MESFGVLNWSIIGFYLSINLFLGWYMSRRVTTANNYFLGDRTAPWWAIGISVMATYVSALSFLGGPAWAYGDGMAALAIHINYSLVIFICIVLFIPFFYNSKVASIYDYLEKRFGLSSRLVMATLFIITTILGVASILAATAIVVAFVIDISPEMAILIMAAIIVVYTLLGGMNAVIWTDVFQGIILIIGALIVLYSLLNYPGSDLASSLQFLADNNKLNPINTDFDISVAPTIWAGVIAMTLYHITVYGANQFMVQRALAAKNIGDAKKSYLVMGFAAFFLYFIFFFIGALLFAHYQGKEFEKTNEIMLIFVNSLAIPGLMGIIGAAILSASMSTTSSALNSLATITVTDFYKRLYKTNGDDRHYLLYSRLFTVMWAIVVLPVAISFVGSKGSILELLSKVASYLVGAKLAMFAMGFYSKHITEKGLLLGVLAGFIVLMLVAPLDILAPLVAPLWQAFGSDIPQIAWPWYVVISGGTNVIVSWLYSIISNGKTDNWHLYSVYGQYLEFKKNNLAEKDNGWYLIPGKVEPITWTLIGFFVVTILFLIWFGNLV